MASLPRELRKELEKAARRARRVAEEGSRKALESLAVHNSEPWPSLDGAQKGLRNRLRAHGRQMGDVRDSQRKTQTIDHLTAKCAYEQWHRMLFARFLAENDLLIEPEMGAIVPLDLCRDLAGERRVDWIALASSYAVHMLSDIFRAGDPVLELTLPPETRFELEEILGALPREIFLADDSLGWVYQFWQAERKEAINKSETKIGADELPAVTQLFTEDYMVLFLLHNTLGAWWAGKVLAERPELATAAKDEQELRDSCAVGEVEWTYLRFLREEDGRWRPGAGTFDGWPKRARQITLIDPCMGSGHFLVFALPMLAAMRAKEESLSKPEAMLAVLRDNLHGLELDPRCTQIAAFNLALATWKAVGHRPLPRLRLACSGLSISASEKEWIELAVSDSRARETMAQLYTLFKQAPVLGSLIDPKRIGGDLFASTFEGVRPALQKALAAEHSSDEENELAISARGLLEAAELLTSEFTLVATNVPYLGRAKQGVVLREYSAPERGRLNLGTNFVERCLKLLAPSRSVAVVVLQGWLFQDQYEAYRRNLLDSVQWNALARLGPGAFETISGEVVNVCLFTCSNHSPREARFLGLDVTSAATAQAKAVLLRDGRTTAQDQRAIKDGPRAVVVFDVETSGSLLSDFASVHYGSKPGQTDRVVRAFWEVDRVKGRSWRFMESTPDLRVPITGKHWICVSAVEIKRQHIEGFGVRGAEVWGQRGVLLSQTASLPCALYLGEFFDNNTSAIVPTDATHLPAVWCFMSSDEFVKEVRARNQKLDVSTGAMISVPFDITRWRDIAAEEFPDGLPLPMSSDPSQWLFHGHLLNSEYSLQVATARLLAYRWPRQTGSSFPDCPALGPDGLESHADEDGIVCLAPMGGERSAADRLRSLLADAYGAEWSMDLLATLLKDAGFAGRSLDDWLRDGFFEQHCALFHQTPFVWHICDGLKNGFHALVNYHRLAAPNGEGRRTLEKLIHTYLGRDWIERWRHDQKNNVQGADEKVVAAEHLRRELTKILEGEPPHDIFVRWKPLHEQPIGWEPDINDGIRLNIRPFMTAKTFNGKPMFRVAPKSIKWGKDRGKEPMRTSEDYPWFWSWDGQTENFVSGGAFDGNRWNDLHYSRAFKEATRANAVDRERAL